MLYTTHFLMPSHARKLAAGEGGFQSEGGFAWLALLCLRLRRPHASEQTARVRRVRGHDL